MELSPELVLPSGVLPWPLPSPGAAPEGSLDRSIDVRSDAEIVVVEVTEGSLPELLPHEHIKIEQATATVLAIDPSLRNKCEGIQRPSRPVPFQTTRSVLVAALCRDRIVRGGSQWLR